MLFHLALYNVDCRIVCTLENQPLVSVSACPTVVNRRHKFFFCGVGAYVHYVKTFYILFLSISLRAFFLSQSLSHWLSIFPKCLLCEITKSIPNVWRGNGCRVHVILLDSRETTLHCNIVYEWLSPNPEKSLLITRYKKVGNILLQLKVIVLALAVSVHIPAVQLCISLMSTVK